jgi:quercetin dioxygenase-like cupin family protein
MIPPDDPQRHLTLAGPDEDQKLRYISVAGGTYTILLTGEDTAERYCLIDMLVPPGSGPPPHRHDFEEMFTILEGEIELTFRGGKSVARAGETVNIPANAPHFFRNSSKAPARLCACVRRRDRKSFSWRSATPSRAGLLGRPSSAKPTRRRERQKPKHSRHDIGRSS